MKLIVVGVNSEDRSYVVSAQTIATPGSGDLTTWEGDPEVIAEWARKIQPGPINHEVEPARVGGITLTIGEINPATTELAGEHATRTVDVFCVLEGRVTLDLDEESVVVEAGDVVVHQATRHRWRAHDGAFRFLAVVMRVA